MQTTATLTSGPSDGLNEIVWGAARASKGASDGVIGIVELRAPLGDSSDGELGIEAEFAHQGERRVIASLEVRCRASGTPATLDRDALLRKALERFGGTAVTNVSATLPSGEGVDMTVSFGSKIPFWAENLLLPVRPGGEPDAQVVREILGHLGAGFEQRAEGFFARRHEIRSRVTVERQIAAYRAARKAGLDTAIYAATLPCSHSVRFAESGPDSPKASLDLVLSRGLTRAYVCTAADAQQMQSLLVDSLGVSFRNKEFEITNTFGDGRATDVQSNRGLRWFAGKKRMPRL
jgi:hypothetical protein